SAGTASGGAVGDRVAGSRGTGAPVEDLGDGIDDDGDRREVLTAHLDRDVRIGLDVVLRAQTLGLRGAAGGLGGAPRCGGGGAARGGGARRARDRRRVATGGVRRRLFGCDVDGSVRGGSAGDVDGRGRGVGADVLGLNTRRGYVAAGGSRAGGNGG